MSKVVVPGKPFFVNNGKPKIEGVNHQILISEADAEGMRLKREAENKKTEEENKIKNKKSYDEQLEAFKKSDVPSIFKSYTVLSDSIILKIFTFKINKSTSLIVDDSEFEKPIAIAKVMAVSPETDSLKPGDIVTISDTIMNIQVNPDYVKLVAELNKRPMNKNLPPLESIPQYIYGINDWERFIFRTDKLYSIPEDKGLFLVPRNYALIKI